MTGKLANLAPLSQRHYNHTFIGGPGSGRTRRECWAADTADGRWRINRIDDVGTPWEIVYVETGEPTGHWYGTLKAARRAIASGEAERNLHEEWVRSMFCWMAHPHRVYHDGLWAIRLAKLENAFPASAFGSKVGQ